VHFLYLTSFIFNENVTGQPGQKSGEEQEGFYLLKKDSQRRMTLTRVLNQDEAKICEVWMRGIHQAEGQTVLQMVCMRCIVFQFFPYLDYSSSRF